MEREAEQVLTRFDTNNMFRKSIYHQRLERKQARARLATAARERNRLARLADVNNWRQVGMFVCVLEAHSDGRHFGVRVIGRDETRIEGTWRTCAAAVGRVWREAAERKRAR